MNFLVLIVRNQENREVFKPKPTIKKVIYFVSSSNRFFQPACVLLKDNFLEPSCSLFEVGRQIVFQYFKNIFAI